MIQKVKAIGLILPALDGSILRSRGVYKGALQRWMNFVHRQIRADLTKKFIKDITSELTDWEYIEDQGESILKPATLRVMQLGGGKAYQIFQAVGAFDVTNLDAIRVTETITATLVRQVTKKTQEGIRHYIADGIREGKSMKKIARELRPIVGLTKNQTQAIINYRNLLEEKRPELSPAQRERLVTAYSNKTHRRRLETIARTETARAQTVGYAQGLKDVGVEQVEFQIHPDEATCPICSKLDGTVYSTEEGQYVIPVHPRCRCVLLPVVDEVPACRLSKGLNKAECIPPANLHDAQVEDLLRRLEETDSKSEKSKIRRSLRKLGHKGGLSGKPAVPAAPRVKPTKPEVPKAKPRPKPSKQRAADVRELEANLTDDQKKAFGSWTRTGYEGMRKADKAGEFDYRLKPFNEILDKAPLYRQNVYRGIRHSIDLKPGDQFNCSALSSFSTNPAVAKSFCVQDPLTKKYASKNTQVTLFNIKNGGKNGSPRIPDVKIGGKYETEIIVTKNRVFRVESVEEFTIKRSGKRGKPPIIWKGKQVNLIEE